MYLCFFPKNPKICEHQRSIPFWMDVLGAPTFWRVKPANPQGHGSPISQPAAAAVLRNAADGALGFCRGVSLDVSLLEVDGSMVIGSMGCSYYNYLLVLMG